MILLAFSSLLFLIPVYLAYIYNMPALVILFACLTITSILNHGRILRPMSNTIDKLLAKTLTIVLTISAFVLLAPHQPLLGISAGCCGILAGIVYKYETQKVQHTLVHVIGAIGFSLYVVGMSRI